ncbi:MAG TPA: outer membrane beta-barrel protein [Blastocatellia bacterium]|nr:outer membrane beta-barrel protein [Blastocatellia bacterium]
MRKLFFIAALTLALPIISLAQDAPRLEVFGGYSYMRLEDDGSGLDRDLNGFNVSGNIAVFGKRLGLKADVSGHFGNIFVATGVPSTDQRQFLFLFGPQYSLRKSGKIQPFAHALFGFTRQTLKNDAISGDLTDTGFAFAAGGGVDLKAIGSRLSLRLLQADYVLTKFGDGASSGNNTNNNVRISTGMVVRFGKIE